MRVLIVTLFFHHAIGFSLTLKNNTPLLISPRTKEIEKFYDILVQIDFDTITNVESNKLVPINGDAVPASYDWRDSCVSPVKDQGSCPACWAFSIVANIESHVCIYNKEKLILSEQFLMDCDSKKTGCSNASILEKYADIVVHYGGVYQTKDYYPYRGHVQKCRVRKDTEPVPVIGFRRVQPDEEVMKEFVYRYGPLSAAINSDSMDNYNGDIDEPTEEQCPSSQENLDHTVLIVGYNEYIDPDTGKSTPYWIIKNSWGTQFGDNGFYYLVRGRNACGIATDVSFSIVK